MKKLFSLALIAVVVMPLCAQEAEAKKEEVKAQQREERKREYNVWPCFFSVCEFPATPDVLGLRLTVPYSTVQENVTGIDLGLWGRCQYFEGVQLNLVRNDVKDDMCGIQCGLYNSIGGGQMLGVQIGLWNESNSIEGVQAGLVNLTGTADGFQIGLINRCETMRGYQVGLINVIRDAELQFCPVVNIGF